MSRTFGFSHLHLLRGLPAHYQPTNLYRSSPNRCSLERPMKIEIVLVPSKSVPLASRVAPASTPATNGAKPAARWVVLSQGHFIRLLFNVGPPPLDVDDDLGAGVALARRRGPPRPLPISTPRWRFVPTTPNAYLVLIIALSIQDYTAANAPAAAAA
jgi:hypothetical protein